MIKLSTLKFVLTTSIIIRFSIDDTIKNVSDNVG